MKKDWPYHDIVNMPHHVSTTRPQMDMLKRAAQFAPFAALTGYDAAIEETARLTDVKIELDETELEELNRKINEAVEKKNEVRVIYFLLDEKKAGGAYVDVTGKIKKIELGKIVMENKKKIRIADVLDAEEV